MKVFAEQEKGDPRRGTQTHHSPFFHRTIPKKSRKRIKVKDDVVLISEEMVKC